MMMTSALYYYNTSSWIFIVLELTQQSADRRWETFFWFLDNQPFLFLLNAEYLAGKQQLPIW
jgi:hypothetical protein